MGRMRVLVVDDELPVRQLLAMFLGYLGHASETASDAAEALSKIDGAEYDLILTDFNMPGMKGDELAKEIKSRKPSMPVVLVTGLEPLGLSQNFDQILLKPFSMQALKETLASLPWTTPAKQSPAKDNA